MLGGRRLDLLMGRRLDLLIGRRNIFRLYGGGDIAKITLLVVCANGHKIGGITAVIPVGQASGGNSVFVLEFIIHGFVF